MGYACYYEVEPYLQDLMSMDCLSAGTDINARGIQLLCGNNDTSAGQQEKGSRYRSRQDGQSEEAGSWPG